MRLLPSSRTPFTRAFYKANIGRSQHTDDSVQTGITRVYKYYKYIHLSGPNIELKWVSGNKVKCTDTAYLCYLSRGYFSQDNAPGKTAASRGAAVQDVEGGERKEGGWDSPAESMVCLIRPVRHPRESV